MGSTADRDVGRAYGRGMRLPRSIRPLVMSRPGVRTCAPAHDPYRPPILILVNLTHPQPICHQLSLRARTYHRTIRRGSLMLVGAMLETCGSAGEGCTFPVIE